MNHSLQLYLTLTLFVSPLTAAFAIEPEQWSEKKPLTEEEKKQTQIDLSDQILKLADRQDELSADIQELIESQTSEQVIKILEEVETLMVEVIDNLEEENTSGDTIAIETEIIERIFQSAQKKQQESSQKKDKKDGEKGEQEQQQGQQSMDGMLEMMKQMMGKGEQQGSKPGKPGDQESEGQKGGEGQKGDSDAASESFSGDASEGLKQRRVPAAGGTIKESLPKEFHKAIDAYNKGAQERAKQRSK